LQVLAGVVAVIDPADEQYEAQKELAEHGVLTAIATLLEDDSAAITAAAADTLLKLTQHSPAVLNRRGPVVVTAVAAVRIVTASYMCHPRV
jgi:hypothetical protein